MRVRRTALRARSCVALVALASVASAHVRLLHPGNNSALHWSSPSSIKIVIQASGSDDVPDGSHFTAFRNAIHAWNSIPGSDAQLIEDTNPTKQARTDWEADSLHLLIFDEDDTSGYFPTGSGTVALTPVWFSSNGAITDADVLFNGSGYSFTTEPVAGFFDIADVATHELGHLLGLDHTGWAGGTMYPYVSPLVIEHRSVAEDEVHGMRHTYPAQSFATISGTIRRALDNSTVAGAHVVALDLLGRTRASVLSSSSGNFTLRGLEADDYVVYVSPFDYPVAAYNLSSGQTVETDFESTFGPTTSVASGSSNPIGNLIVDANVTLSLGRSNDRLPLRGIVGQTNSFLLRGMGLDSTCTMTCSDPAIGVVVVSWLNTLVALEITVPVGAERGHADLVVSNLAGDLTILPGAIEITPPDPGLTSVTSAIGPSVGGTSLTIDGTDFYAGARVVLGSEIYIDGEIDCEVVDANTIDITTRATAIGTYDVVVIDASGEEGRLAGAFEFAAIPVLQTLFPTSGAAAGGTELVITGQTFQSGVQVRIDGVTQTQVTVQSATVLRVITESGIAGGPYIVEVENPGGELATTAFSYAANADPQIATLTPASGKTAGGTQITISGTNFSATNSVTFGADPDTGLGGSLAASVTFVDANTLLATTPAGSAGSVSVLVLDSSSGQASVVPAAFAYKAPSPGGGGGCYTIPLDAPSDPRAPFEILGPLAVALLFFVATSHRARRIR